ncbi:MAG: glucosidase [Acidobacteriota bacterium]|nr:glucosidase [Acidobacteriota bacterium]
MTSIMAKRPFTAEAKRLEQATQKTVDWKLWGSYVSDRAWGTVREDYSADGSAWDYFPFEHSHLRAYRWNEDGIAGICDRKQNICFALSLWNGQDSILKQRLFGLAGPKGNHGEDVKEYYYYLDNTPTHSYMKFLYKYPQAAFPYENLYQENGGRDKSHPEYELIDTGVFDDDKYFDVFVEYAKADAEDICIKITAINRSETAASIHILPTVWFRNTWSWAENSKKPLLQMAECDIKGLSAIQIKNANAEVYRLLCEGTGELLFDENETNYKRLYGGENKSVYAKDGINDFVVHNNKEGVSPLLSGTKAAARYKLSLPPKSAETIYLRFSRQNATDKNSFSSKTDFKKQCEKIFVKRKNEADDFYATVIPPNLTDDAKNIMRQAFAGMLWSKQYFHYEVENWLEGDPAFPPPPNQRVSGRNSDWKHLYNDDIISMPDKWEYPWYASWDLAFHCIPIALIDPELAKRQLILLLREWYMHPNGQIPAYEWAFGDVNPPVHAWAALRVYKIEEKRKGVGDRSFLEKVFHKLLLNFTWWVNRKDEEGNNVFSGGFLGLDNIGVFDRSEQLPNGGHLEQSDGTSWMAMFCLNMLAIALELAEEDKVYEDVASKFFEHFVYISDAMNNVGNDDTKLWNEDDGFYYDAMHIDGQQFPIKLRSMVGLIPLFAVESLEPDWLEKLPDFRRRTEWFLKNRPDLTDDIACMQSPGVKNRRLLALVNESRLRRVLTTMLSEDEFLSDYGIRSMSLFHKDCPYFLMFGDTEYRVKYEPGESRSGMFGGNSNWRGPIWFPVNFLLIESLQKFHHFYGENFQIEFPTGSGKMLTLWKISQELEKRLCRIFLKDETGKRALFGDVEKFYNDDHWCENLLFHEYFHGENGWGLGANHQTGWTGLIAKLLQQLGEYSDK